MRRYKNYLFSLVFCICSICSIFFFYNSYQVKEEFGRKVENNIVLLSANTQTASKYVVITEKNQQTVVSVAEHSSPNVILDFPKEESYFIQFFEEKIESFQRPTDRIRIQTILTRFSKRVLRI